MEENKRSDIKIENGVATWEMRMEGLIEGTYAGIFKFRCILSPLQSLQAGRDYRDLLGQNAALASEEDSYTAWVFAQLKQRVISSPPFFTSSLQNGSYPGDILDREVLTAIIDAAVYSETQYKADLKARKEAAIKRAKGIGETIANKDKASTNADKEALEGNKA